MSVATGTTGATGTAPLPPDPAWPQGTWTNTKGYRPAGVRATLVYVALAIEGLAYTGMIVISVAGFGLVDRALSGSLTETEVTAYVATEKGVAGLALLAGILAVVMSSRCGPRGLETTNSSQGRAPHLKTGPSMVSPCRSARQT